MGAPAGPDRRAAMQVAAGPPDRRSGAGAPSASRFGEISPALGARIEMGFSLGARNAEARALSSSVRRSPGSSRGPALPVAIPTVRTLPASRVRTTIVIEPDR